jgi:uroporphyrinogen-III synthase
MSAVGDSKTGSPRPLAGLSIVVTRADHQAQELAEPLRTLGAHVILLPMIGIAPPSDAAPLTRAIESIAEYDWIFFTSINAVRAVAPRVGTRPAGRVGVVGAATQASVEKLGWRVDVVPKDFTAEGLLVALEGFDLRGQRVLIPSGDRAREVLPETLRSRGAVVDVVEAYKNQLPRDTEVRAIRLFAVPKPPDWLTFASPSAVDNLVSVVGAEALQRSKIASIGPVTSAAVRAHGLEVAVEPADHTIAGLVAVIVDSVIS